MSLWNRLRKKPDEQNLPTPISTSRYIPPAAAAAPDTVTFKQQKIHPDQNALAEELEREHQQEVSSHRQIPIPRPHSPHDIDHAEENDVSMLSLRPSPRRKSNASSKPVLDAHSPLSQRFHEPISQTTHNTHNTEISSTNPDAQSPQEPDRDATELQARLASSMIPISRSPSASSSSHSQSHQHRHSSTKHTPESSISKHSPTFPPSAWQSTFGMSKSRKIIPRLLSFNKSSTSPSTVSSAHNTTTDSVPSSPSSLANIFGSKQTAATRGSSSPTPPMPTLNHPAFVGSTESAQELNTSNVNRLKKPRKARRWKSKPMLDTEVEPARLDIRSENAESSHASTLGSPFSFRVAPGDTIKLSIASSSQTRFEDVQDSNSLSRTAQDRGMSRDHNGVASSGDASASSAAVLSPLSSSSNTVELPRTPISGDKSKGKRKADELGGEGHTPPDLKKEKQQHRATFAADPRPHRESGTSRSSHAPSSYTRKRARLSGTNATTAASIAEALAASSNEASSSIIEAPRPQHAMGSVASRSSAAALHRSKSRSSNRPPSRSDSKRTQRSQDPSDRPDRRHTRSPSLSQASIPLSALISPHAPSIARSSVYHMRDPRKPPKVQTTPWSLSFPDSDPDHKSLVTRLVARLRGSRDPTMDSPGWTERGGSPVHAWMFFIGFILFPLWWIASFLPIPRTRRLNADAEQGGAEKVILDDPQIEYDARSWRNRCRVLGGVSLVTYIPFIVCVAIFA